MNSETIHDTFFRFAKLQILCVRDAVLTDPFRAQLRKEDVRLGHCVTP